MENRVSVKKRCGRVPFYVVDTKIKKWEYLVQVRVKLMNYPIPTSTHVVWSAWSFQSLTDMVTLGPFQNLLGSTEWKLKVGEGPTLMVFYQQPFFLNSWFEVGTV